MKTVIAGFAVALLTALVASASPADAQSAAKAKNGKCWYPYQGAAKDRKNSCYR